MKVLVAGVGNVFLCDDGFGVEVVRRLQERGGLPAGVELLDVGIRGVHLAYQLLDGYDVLVLVDASGRGDVPGTVYVLEHDLGAPPPEVPPLDGHGLDPDAVLALLANLGDLDGRGTPGGAGPRGRVRARDARRGDGPVDARRRRRRSGGADRHRPHPRTSPGRSPPMIRKLLVFALLGIAAVVAIGRLASRDEIPGPRSARCEEPMCLGIPGEVIELMPTTRTSPSSASRASSGRINIGLLEDGGVEPGDWVLIHVGFAMSKIDEAEAKASLRCFLTGRRCLHRRARRSPTRISRDGRVRMSFVDEYRDAATRVLATRSPRCASRAAGTSSWRCAAGTRTPSTSTASRTTPPTVSLVHGPGCPVCVIPMGRVDDAIAIAETPGRHLHLVRRHDARARRPRDVLRLQGGRRRHPHRLLTAGRAEDRAEEPRQAGRVLGGRLRDHRPVDRDDRAAGRAGGRRQLLASSATTSRSSRRSRRSSTRPTCASTGSSAPATSPP